MGVFVSLARIDRILMVEPRHAGLTGISADAVIATPLGNLPIPLERTA